MWMHHDIGKGSDIVSLMVMTHQTQLHNPLKVNYEVRAAIHDEGGSSRSLRLRRPYQECY
jgi:hypothetical protein